MEVCGGTRVPSICKEYEYANFIFSLLNLLAHHCGRIISYDYQNDDRVSTWGSKSSKTKIKRHND